MSMDVTQLRGYDPAMYNDLRAAVEQSGGKISVYDKKVITLVNAGQSFADAVAQAKAEIPSLTSPSESQTLPISDLKDGSKTALDEVKALITQLNDADQQGNLELVNELSQQLDSIIEKEQIPSDVLSQLFEQMSMYA